MGIFSCEKKDYITAYQWFSTAVINNKNHHAQNNLGVLYENGWGVKQDFIEANNWYRLSAQQYNAKAEYNISQVYKNGHGVDKDTVKSQHWLRKAALHGDKSIQNELAVLYENENALHWYLSNSSKTRLYVWSKQCWVVT